MALMPVERPARNAVRVSLACVQCRSRHVRCDAATPTCTRCRNDGSRCTYNPSRRSGRPRRQRVQPHSPSLQVITAHPDTSDRQLHAPDLPADWGDLLDSFLVVSPDLSRDSGLSSLGSSAPSPRTISKRPLVELYYANFHDAHPCVLPMWHLEQKFAEEFPGHDSLLIVMQFIGSLYSDEPSSPCDEDVTSALGADESCDSLFSVQALLLYAIAVYWRNDIRRSRDLLRTSTLKAVRLGMNHERSAVSNSGGDTLLAESWRRTWWQLYITDLHVAAIARDTSFGTSRSMVEVTVGLPCEEAQYACGVIPTPYSLHDYEDRELSTDGSINFSSFAHLIGLATGLDHTVVTQTRNSEETLTSICREMDANVSAWLSLLPKSKRTLFSGDDGHVDNLLVKAKLMIQVYTVEVHRPLSTIKFDPIESISSCAPPPPPERMTLSFHRNARVHNARIRQAIDDAAEILTLPMRIVTQTPFTICIIASVAITQAAAYRHVMNDQQRTRARNHIRLAIGTLKLFSEVWPRGGKVAGEVQAIAAKLLRSSGSEATTEALRLPQTGATIASDVASLSNLRDSPSGTHRAEDALPSPGLSDLLFDTGTRLFG